MSESQFQAKVIKFLQMEDVYHVKVWGGGFQRAGIPDILACLKGKFLAIELKTEIGKTSKLQNYNLERIKESGGTTLVLRPSGFEDFKEYVREVKRCSSVTQE